MPAPTKYPDWATDGTNVVEPPAGKKAAGWVPAEEPPSGWFNWWQGIVGQWTRWLESRINTTDASLTALDADHDALAADAARKSAANTFTQPQTIPNIAGDLHVAGEVIATGHLTAGGSVYTGSGGQVVSGTHVLAGAKVSGQDVQASNQFQYAAAKTRTITINPLSCFGGTLANNIGQGLDLAAAAATVYPLDVPHGAVLKGVFVKLAAGSAGASTTATLSLYKHTSIDMVLGGLPSYLLVDQEFATVPDENAYNETRLSFGNLVATSLEAYSLNIINTGGNVLHVRAIQLVYDETVLTTHGSR